MKRVLSILVAVMMLVSAMALSASAAKTYTAAYGTPTLDGVASAGEWDKAAASVLDVRTNPGKALSADPTVKLMHDGTYLYILIQGPTPDAKVNTFVCVHVPHGNCDGDCGSYIKAVVDNGSVAKGDDNPVWTYSKDANGDGVNDFAEGTNGGKADLIKVAYGFVNGQFTAEVRVAANYGNAIPAGKLLVDVRIDADTVWATHQWGNQPRTWDPTWSPKYDGVEVTLAAGAAAAGTSAPTEDTSAPTEDTSAPTEDTSAPTENTTANEPANTGSTNVPATADAGLAIAAVVMAAAAMVVLSKKH